MYGILHGFSDIFNLQFNISYKLYANFIYYVYIIDYSTSIDGFTQYLGLRESNNNLRFFTGLIGGVGLIILFRILFKMIYGVFYEMS